MFQLVLISLLTAPTPLAAYEYINQFCAQVVGVEYGTDNFTDDEWSRFVYCREHIMVPTNFTPSNYIN